jgi:hypothetical protein
MVTPASIASADSTVNSRLVSRFSSLIASSWAVRGNQETCQRERGWIRRSFHMRQPAEEVQLIDGSTQHLR